MSSRFGGIPLLTSELAALERLKKRYALRERLRTYKVFTKKASVFTLIIISSS